MNILWTMYILSQKHKWEPNCDNILYIGLNHHIVRENIICYLKWLTSKTYEKLHRPSKCILETYGVLKSL